MAGDDHGDSGTAEGAGASLGEAKWGALKALEPAFPGVAAEDVDFEVLDPGDEDADREAPARGHVRGPASGPRCVSRTIGRKGARSSPRSPSSGYAPWCRA